MKGGMGSGKECAPLSGRWRAGRWLQGVLKGEGGRGFGRGTRSHLETEEEGDRGVWECEVGIGVARAWEGRKRREMQVIHDDTGEGRGKKRQ